MVSKMKNWAPCLVLLAITMMGSALTGQPNVVFIIVDDMGWNDVSFHGSDQIQTPNLDALAYRGVILQQYYSEAICTPARTALLTGKYPMRLGMQGVPLSNVEDRGIPVSEKLLPSYLKDLGYATHLVGKWHVGMSRPEFLPEARGYDTHYGIRGGLVDYYTYNKVEDMPDGRQLYGLDLFDGNVPQIDEKRYIIDAFTDRAVNIINGHNKSQPLFLHYTHTAPHSGNEAAKLQPPLNSTGNNEHIAHSDRRLYADVMNSVDNSVGKVVRALEDNGILDDTIIIFASDNGAPTVGMMSQTGLNLPLRGIKETPWEGGVRVPAFVWHSSLTPRVWNGLMHITDWLPTLTTAAGGRFTDKIDGVNQWGNIVRDGKSQRKEILLAIDESSRYAAYRSGDYKIVVGNVTGIRNGYYGQDYTLNRRAPPEYYPALEASEVAGIFKQKGIYLDLDEVSVLRAATAIQQKDTVADPTPCAPTQYRGCLFNIRRDPTESHDLWEQETEIANKLSARLREILSNLRERPPMIRQLPQGDPANFNFTYVPWIVNGLSTAS